MNRHQQLPANVARLLDAAASNNRVPKTLARAVAWVESRGEQTAVSPKGALGVMQLMPRTAADMNVDPNVLEQNIAGGVAYLARMLRKYSGDEAIALAAYNWGPGNVDDAINAGTDGFPESVQQYVRNVVARRIEEGNRSAAGPFLQPHHFSCPHCRRDVTVRVELELEVES